MSEPDSEAIKRQIALFLPRREAEMGGFTDSVLLRSLDNGACGLASCLYVEWKGRAYAISCHHALAEGREYIAGARRLQGATIDEGGSNEVAPLSLLASDSALDLALFDLNGLGLPSIPKRAYPLAENGFTSTTTAGIIRCVAFIHAVPGFAMRGFQYPDELVFSQFPIYSAYGPIVDVSDEVIVADFAEVELIELESDAFPHLADFTPNGGTRDLSGMSGSGLWVISEDRFQLIGVLLGTDSRNDPQNQHLIRFTPIWKVVAWLESLDLTVASAN